MCTWDITVTCLLDIIIYMYVTPGNHLEGKTTAVPLRKPHGAAVYPLHEILGTSNNGDQEEKDIQMDVFVYALLALNLHDTYTYHVSCILSRNFPPKL